MLRDEELASRIAIPSTPMKRKVLLPDGPPPYELCELVKSLEDKQAAENRRTNAGALSPGEHFFS